ncbi:hypothetical protein X975_09516, partial [Stegodyphus mimosarum]
MLFLLILKQISSMEMQRWIDDQIFQLIEFYRENNALWNTNNSNYKNKKFKDSLILNLNDTAQKRGMEEDSRCSYEMPEDEDFETDDIEKSQKISELHDTP